MKTIYLTGRDPYIIGQTGESNAVTLRVDVDEWKDAYDGGHGILTFRWPNKTVYPLDTNLVQYNDKYYLEAIVTSNETRYPGWVVVQAQWYDGETLVYSRAFSCKVLQSHDGYVPGGDTVPTWVTALIARLDAMDDTEAAVETYKEGAELAAQNAADSLSAAQAAAESAGTSAATATQAAETATQKADSIPADFTGLVEHVAEMFDATKAYTAGDYVWNGSKLYRFTTDHAAGAWTGTDAVEVVVTGEVSDLKSDLTQLGNTFGKLQNPDNWYLRRDFSLGILSNTTGTISEATDKKYTNYYIPVHEGDYVYYARCNGTSPVRLYVHKIAAYDADKNLLSDKGRGSRTVSDYVVPAGVSYIRMTVDVVQTIEDDPNRYKPMIFVGEEGLSTYSRDFVPYMQTMLAAPYPTPEMYGAYGDGQHDDTLAVQKAVDAGRALGIPVMLSKNYAITACIEVSGTVIGSGTVSLLDKTTRLEGGFFMTTGNATIKGITFDCTSSVEFTIDDKFTAYNNAIRHLSAGGDLIVDGCTFKGLYNRFVAANGNNVTRVTVVNCLFDATNLSNHFMAECVSISSITNNACVVVVKNNRFYGYVGGTEDQHDNAAAIVSSNANVKSFLIADNVMYNMGRLANNGDEVGFSRLCAIDFYFNASNIVISNNKMLLCNWVPIRLHGVKNVKVFGNEFGTAKYINEPLLWISDAKSSTDLVPIGTEDIVIEQNEFVQRGRGHASAAIHLTSIPRHDTAASAISRVLIKNNTIRNLYCEQIIYFDNTLKSCVIQGNHIEGDTEYAAVGIMGAPYGSASDQTDFSGTKLRIIDNDIDIPKGTAINLIDALGIHAEISGNRINATNGYCIRGCVNAEDKANISAYANLLSGERGISNIGKAVRNIGECTYNYAGITESSENWQNS